MNKALSVVPKDYTSCSPDTCNFAEMVPLFQALFEPDQSRMMSLMAKIKNLLRVGAAPSRLNSGQGKTALYRAEEVWELLVEMELGDIGIPPQRAIEIFRANPHMAYRPDLSGRLPINRRPTSHVLIDADWLVLAARKHLPQLFGEHDTK